MNYYFLASSLPELSFDSPPELSFQELFDLLETNLTAEDLKKIEKIRDFYAVHVDLREYFDEAVAKSSGFLRDYFSFELEWRLAMTAFRAKNVYENEHLKALYEKFCHHPLELHQAIETYRFDKIGEMIGIDHFSLNRILSYFIQYTIVDKQKELACQI